MIDSVQAQRRTGSSQMYGTFILFSFIIILLGSTSYFYYQYHKLSQNGPQIATQEEGKRVATAVGKLMLLPHDETPTIATVTDIKKLQDQPFFKNAANGNKVLIFPTSKLAIIYDSKQNLIINVGPVNFSPQSTQQVQKIRIGLRNGTKVIGITRSVETDIVASFPDTTITLREQDKRTDYTNTTVIDVNGVFGTLAEKIAQTLHSQVASLPVGETKPDGVDILIIVGTDKK